MTQSLLWSDSSDYESNIRSQYKCHFSNTSTCAPYRQVPVEVYRGGPSLYGNWPTYIFAARENVNVSLFQQWHGKLWQANRLHCCWSTSHAWLYGCGVPEQKDKWSLCTTRTCSNTPQRYRYWCFPQPATTGGETKLLSTIWCYHHQQNPDCLEEEMAPFYYPD